MYDQIGEQFSVRFFFSETPASELEKSSSTRTEVLQVAVVVVQDFIQEMDDPFARK